jgi:hypothetical protein
MALKSNLLSGDERLEACAVRDSAHILPGSVGTHVARIQIALAILDGASIDSKEAKSHTYGRSTTAAVLAYKKRRNIINWSYQTQADNIVGKMTIAALDAEMCVKENSYSRLRWVPRHRYESGTQGEMLRPAQVGSMTGGTSPVSSRSCKLRPGSSFAAWPPDLLETLCRSYVSHSPKLTSLPEAFEWGSEVEPADFDDALTKAHAEFVKTVYDRAAAITGLWAFVHLIFNAWKTDNQGFVFSVKDVADRRSLPTFLDGSPRFCRDVPLMQFFHEGGERWGSRILVPTHQCWREVVKGSPGLHICISNAAAFSTIPCTLILIRLSCRRRRMEPASILLWLSSIAVGIFESCLILKTPGHDWWSYLLNGDRLITSYKLSVDWRKRR